MKRKQHMRILIAGLGSIGQRHLKNLSALGVHDICLYRTGKGALKNDALASYPTYHDLEQALADKPDAVIVANPTSMHMDVALPAAEAGCHLFLEKPVSHSMEGVGTLRCLADQNTLTVMTGFQFRFHPTLQDVKRWLNDHAIGKIVAATSHWGEFLPDWHPWEDWRQGYSARSEMGGGVVFTLCHPFDYLRWLLGDVARVSASIRRDRFLDIDAEETAQITLDHTDGTISTVHLNYLQKPPQHTLQIIGEKGMIRWDNGAGKAVLTYAGSNRMEIGCLPEDFDRNDMFLGEMAHFLNCLKNAKSPACSLDDGTKVLQIALAAHRSSKERKTIDLDEQV